MLLLSMGAGGGCDAQYLFSVDVLGYTTGHVPRHSKRYRDFRAELDRLQAERVGAFSEYAADVDSGCFPAEEHLLGIPDDEFAAFQEQIA